MTDKPDTFYNGTNIPVQIGDHVDCGRIKSEFYKTGKIAAIDDSLVLVQWRDGVTGWAPINRLQFMPNLVMVLTNDPR
jgi:hypothetical protein